MDNKKKVSLLLVALLVLAAAAYYFKEQLMAFLGEAPAMPGEDQTEALEASISGEPSAIAPSQPAPTSSLTPSTDAALIEYFRSTAQVGGYTTVGALSSKIQGVRNWASNGNQLSHPTFRYVAIDRAQGKPGASNAQITLDIEANKAKIFS